MKTKFKMASLMIAVVMMAMSISAFAGSASQNFGTTSNAKATLAVADQWGQATTTKISGSGSVSTMIRLGNSNGVGTWSSGTSSASITAPGSNLSGKATYGESVHYCGSDSTWLYAAMN